jgi:hypothetical protein
MPIDFSKLKKQTVAIVGFFLFNISASQIAAFRNQILPMLVGHPRISSTVISLIGIALTLHSPMTQNFLHKLYGASEPDVPAVPGAELDGVEVVAGESPESPKV